MRALTAPCLLMVAATILAVPGLARDVPSYARPWVPPHSDPSLAREAQAGALALLQANCELNDAHSALISGEIDKANGLISEAVTEYFNGADAFLTISKTKDTLVALHVPSQPEVEEALRSLERYKITAPRTYHDAFVRLFGWVSEEADKIKGAQFNGQRSDIEILRKLINVQGGIAEVFIDITILTISAST